MVKSSGKLGPGVKNSEEAGRSGGDVHSDDAQHGAGAEVKWGKVMEGNRDSR